MLNSLFLLLLGFILGLLYSRGRAEPLQSAWIDFNRLLRRLFRLIAALVRSLLNRAHDSRPAG